MAVILTSVLPEAEAGQGAAPSGQYRLKAKESAGPVENLAGQPLASCGEESAALVRDNTVYVIAATSKRVKVQGQDWDSLPAVGKYRRAKNPDSGKNVAIEIHFRREKAGATGFILYLRTDDRGALVCGDGRQLVGTYSPR